MEKKRCQDVKDVKDVKVTEMGLAPSFEREGREGPTRARVFPSHLQPRDAIHRFHSLAFIPPAPLDQPPRRKRWQSVWTKWLLIPGRSLQHILHTSHDIEIDRRERTEHSIITRPTYHHTSQSFGHPVGEASVIYTIPYTQYDRARAEGS